MQSILKYPGAKWALAPWIVQHLPRMPYYVEPYCGSAAVFCNLPWRPTHAVLNDLDGDIVNLFRVIRERGGELATLVEVTPWARGEYELSYEPSDDPLERARRFLVRVWQSHGFYTAVARHGWSLGPMGDCAASRAAGWRRLPPRIVAAAALLQAAHIANDPALTLLKRYQRSDVLIYADPPYPPALRKRGIYTEDAMTDADHLALLDVLDAHPGPVALSGNACALYDDRLTHWHRVTTPARAERGGARTEVLWLNNRAQPRQQQLWSTNQ
jgi:DNA adenine methylase